MQLKPCKGRYIFEEPISQDYKIDYELRTHWHSFEVISLEKNHRQGDDRVYADMLNRFRIGQQTQEDISSLRDRVRPKNHKDLIGAMVVSCTNHEVVAHNQKMLNEGDVKYKLFRRRFVTVQDSFEFSVEAYTDALPSHLFHIRFVSCLTQTHFVM